MILATNTMHRVAVELQGAICIPLIHTVAPTVDAVTTDGAETLGLLGTAPVMKADFYRARFADFGFEVLVPAERDLTVVQRVIFEELTREIVHEHCRHEYVRIMRDLVARGAQGIVLGCTEISLLVSAENMPGTFLHDTTALHVDRAVRISLGLHPLITDPVSRLG